jgi:putative NADPH-quinone reductase
MKAMLVVTIGGSSERYSARGVNGPNDDFFFHFTKNTLFYANFHVLPTSETTSHIIWMKRLSRDEDTNCSDDIKHWAILNQLDSGLRTEETMQFHP